jgi:DNA (cytosine-5)-methyltransferase 1
MMIIGSLFSGFGLLEHGLAQALLARGIRSRVAWQAEKDPYARAVLEKHWPETYRYEDVHDISEKTERCDIICGGFPCQDLSIAGGRAGITGEQSGLWFEFVRIIRLLRPRYVFVENVPELLAFLGEVLGPLAQLGYDAEWDLFDAASVGAPHRRERLFVLAHANGVGLRHGQPSEDRPAAPTDADGLGPEGGLGGRDASVRAPTAGHGGRRDVADADGDGRKVPRSRRKRAAVSVAARGGTDAADADGEHVHALQERLCGGADAAIARGHGAGGPVEGPGRALGDTQGERRDAAGSLAGAADGEPAVVGPGADELGRRAEAERVGSGACDFPAWPPEPAVCRVVDGRGSRLDARIRRARLRGLGNAVVWRQAKLAFLKLAERAGLKFGASDA